jgi:hypothetical protein
LVTACEHLTGGVAVGCPHDDLGAYDGLIVGGGAAGLSAGLVLGPS